MTSVAATDKMVEEGVEQVLDLLSPEGKEMLSKVLFPDTLTDEVLVLGEIRKIKPLTIKWAKKVEKACTAHAQKAAAALDSQADTAALIESVDGTMLDQYTIQGVLSAVLILAECYGWKDITAAVAEEDIALPEVTNLVHSQVRLNGTSDFLLAPARVLINVMKIPELIEMSVFLNMRITRPSAAPGPSGSTS